VATVSKESYLRLIENRPYKFDADEVNYRDGDGEEFCVGCAHFYARVIDKFHTCEIFRPEDDSAVDPTYVCDFFTANNEDFPLLKSTDKTSAKRHED
jgi:hypothetical protein